MITPYTSKIAKKDFKIDQLYILIFNYFVVIHGIKKRPDHPNNAHF